MKHLYLLLVVMLAVSATKAQTSPKKGQTPIELNDDLAVITDSLYSKGQKWGAKFNEAYETENYSTLKPITEDMLNYIDSKIIYVQNMKDVKNSKPLRTAMLEFLAFERKMVADTFRPFEAFSADTAEEDIQAALNNLTERSKDEETYIKKIAATQEAYGAENGFKIDTGQ